MIEIRLDKYAATPDHVVMGTYGSHGVETLQITFSADWDGLTKWVEYDCGTPDVAKTVESDGTSEVPYEATAAAGRFAFKVVGLGSNGKRINSVAVGYMVLDTAMYDEADPDADMQSLFEQYIAAASDAADTANEAAADLRTAAENGDFDGEDGGYYAPSVDSSGNLTWAASKQGMPSVSGANIKGTKGDTGNTGADGADGADGGYYVPSVDASGNLTWTPSDVSMPYAPGANIKGPQGDPGQDAVIDPTLTQPGEAADAKATGDALAAKADQSGEYSDLFAGNLIPTAGVNDNAPYTFRTSGGNADIGDRMNDKIVGGTICWNQLVDSDTIGITLISGHKYIYTNGASLWFLVEGTGSATTVSGGNDVAFDLTQMFGSTIADHIYALEQGTAGAGVAWFRKLFPNPRYAYNS